MVAQGYWKTEIISDYDIKSTVKARPVIADEHLSQFRCIRQLKIFLLLLTMTTLLSGALKKQNKFSGLKKLITRLF